MFLCGLLRCLRGCCSSQEGGRHRSRAPIHKACSECSMWCGRGAGIVGAGGGGLVVAGAVQGAAGLYYLLTTPFFQTASNIWTGAVGVLAGLLLLHCAWRRQTNRRARLVLAAALMALAVNVINIVIVQVGEASYFLSEEDRVYITAMTLQRHLQIAVWVSTGATCLALVVSFIVAQVIFCLSLRNSPHLKGHFSVASRYSTKNYHNTSNNTHDNHSDTISEVPEGSEGTSQSRQVVHAKKINHGKSRFFPPSRLTATQDHDSSTLSPVGDHGSLNSAADPLAVEVTSAMGPSGEDSGYACGDVEIKYDYIPISQNTDGNLLNPHSFRARNSMYNDMSARNSVGKGEGSDRLHSTSSTISTYLRHADSNSCRLSFDLNTAGTFRRTRDSRVLPLPNVYLGNVRQEIQEDSTTHDFPQSRLVHTDIIVTRNKSNTNVCSNGIHNVTIDDIYDLPYYGNYLSEEDHISVPTSGAHQVAGVHETTGPTSMDGRTLNVMRNKPNPSNDDYDADDDDVFEGDFDKKRKESAPNMYSDDVMFCNKPSRAYNTFSGQPSGFRRKNMKQRLSEKFKNKTSLYKKHNNNSIEPKQKEQLANNLPENQTTYNSKHVANHGGDTGEGCDENFNADLMPEDSVPYFLRNHPESWKYILPQTDDDAKNILEKDSCTDGERAFVDDTPTELSYHPLSPHLLTRYSSFKPDKSRPRESVLASYNFQGDIYSHPFDIPSQTHRGFNVCTTPYSTLRPASRQSYIACIDTPSSILLPATLRENKHERTSNTMSGVSNRHGMLEPITDANQIPLNQGAHNHQYLVDPHKTSEVRQRPNTLLNLETRSASSRRESQVKDYIEQFESSSFCPMMVAQTHLRKQQPTSFSPGYVQADTIAEVNEESPKQLGNYQKPSTEAVQSFTYLNSPSVAHPFSECRLSRFGNPGENTPELATPFSENESHFLFKRSISPLSLANQMSDGRPPSLIGSPSSRSGWKSSKSSLVKRPAFPPPPPPDEF